MKNRKLHASPFMPYQYNYLRRKFLTTRRAGLRFNGIEAFATLTGKTHPLQQTEIAEIKLDFFLKVIMGTLQLLPIF